LADRKFSTERNEGNEGGLRTPLPPFPPVKNSLAGFDSCRAGGRRSNSSFVTFVPFCSKWPQSLCANLCVSRCNAGNETIFSRLVSHGSFSYELSTHAGRSLGATGVG